MTKTQDFAQGAAGVAAAEGETIFALASGRGAAGVAVFRISGPAAGTALAALTGTVLPPARRAVRAALRDPATGTRLDDALTLWFPAPASFTGEDVAELHVHGGRAVIEAVAVVLGGLKGLRPAEAGEFTRRAFENGKLDLAQAEALADLVAAETEAQRKQAFTQFEGGLTGRFEAWRAGILALLAHVEAHIDFADEDVPASLLSDVANSISELLSTMRAGLADRHRGERLRTGSVIAIIGAPNVGKSSLLNHLARREAAIVSETEGTTRDVIEVHLDLGGWPVTLLDTAGLREATDSIEAEGVRRAQARAETADLKLCVFDVTRERPLDPATAAHLGTDAFLVLNKADLRAPDAIFPDRFPAPAFLVSARTGDGIAGLLAAIEARLRADADDAGPAPLTRARHRRALEDAVAALARAETVSEPELLAEELRLAARAVGRITGRVDVEDVLDRIFAEFCIGK